MRWALALWCHAICAALMAALYVMAPPEFLGPLLMIWITILVVASNRSNRRHRAEFVPALLLVQVAVWTLTVWLAAGAPVKTRDRLLSRRLVLPSTEMSVRELSTYAEGMGDRFPVETQVLYPEAQADRVVRWPTREIDLREFVRCVEQQSSLRHRFGGCGNGTTILWGEDCSFGLVLRDPNELR